MITIGRWINHCQKAVFGFAPRLQKAACGFATIATATIPLLAGCGPQFGTLLYFAGVGQDQKTPAEFTLPKVDGDEYDGRLTIMAAGGGFDGNIGRWRGEFDGLGQDDVKTETVSINGLEANRVDIRGVWKGPSFKPVPPREGYRLIAVILPTGAQSAYYVKVTGPANTVAEHLERIDQFVQSAKLKK